MSSLTRFDVAVIGGGVMGCAAARALALRKQRVVLFEKAHLGHTGGSSHGRSRIIRLAYAHTAYIALSRAAYPAWERLSEEAGEPLMRITGGLDLAFAPVESWHETARAMTAAGVPYEVLDRDEIARRFPQFRLPEGTRALLQPDAGVLHADRCLHALAAAARRAGVNLREHEEVLSIKPLANGVELQTPQAAYGADRLVIAAGAATDKLLQPLGCTLPISASKEQVVFFRPHDPALHGPDRLPVFIFHLGGRRLASGFPLLREDGLKLMIENKRPALDGDNAIDRALLERLKAEVRRILPGLDAQAARAETCRYTLTPDEDFILDRHPAYPHVVIASPCSGHGFKFAPLFGEVLADLAMDGTPSIDLDLFRIDRPALRPSARSATA
ncbi:N-methyl-L-tryptophan oxidase [Rhodoligotrophos defluvii]|uniref:N-methyl-L-tryptophan oxidase n=1 Tax=Rhodoligotrophos defluvii TaxID=2561934 RepID=UPI0010C9433B|nr:N-methyl-L-tryptophan oxidase [Rhodoligotrophos defluvii]